MTDETIGGPTGGEEVNASPSPEAWYGCPVVGDGAQRALHVPRERLVDVAESLRSEGYWMCLDVVGVDYLAAPPRALPDHVEPERFEVVVLLVDPNESSRVRLRVQVPEDDPTYPSLVSVWPSADFGERETFDLMGLVAEGHPKLSRILMPDDWDGHPLRKDFAVGAIPVQFKEA